MRFTVAYHPNAVNELTDIWLASEDLQNISDSSNYIDRILRSSADRLGVNFESFRRLRVLPLEVDFTVSIEDCYVEVKHVRHIAR